MHFFKAIIATAFAATVLAQDKLEFTKAPTNIQAGNSYPIEWQGGDSSEAVTILLKQGPSTDLKTVSTLTASGTGGSYTWEVPTTIVSASDYSFEIVQGTATNYWTTVVIAGGSGVASSSSASASTSATSASASASSASASSASASSASASSASASSASASSASASASSSSSAASSSLSSALASSSSAASSRSSATSAASSSASASASSSSASASASNTASAAAPSSTGNGAQNLKSNAAFVLGAAAAMAYLA